MIFCVISSEPAQDFMLNSRSPPDKPVTKSGHVVTESGPRLDVVRMLHHIAIPLGDRVNGRNKEDIRLSYAKIFGIFEYKWQCAI